MKSCFIFFVPLLLSFLTFANDQSSKIDSLFTLLKTAKKDTNKVIILNLLAWELTSKGEFENAFKYANQGFTLAHKLDYKKGIGNSYYTIGNIYESQGDYSNALKNYLDCLKIRKEMGDKQGVADSYNNIGIIYEYRGDYPAAIENYLISLKFHSEIGDKKGIANAYSNIGIVYEFQGDYTAALKNYFECLKIYKELGYKNGIALSYNNIAMIYKEQGDHSNALKNHFESLKIKKEIGDKQGIAYSYNNIGLIYKNQYNYPAAIENYLKSLNILKELGNKVGIAASYNNLGNVYRYQGNLSKEQGDTAQANRDYSAALKNHFESLKIKEETGDNQGNASSYNNIGIIYYEQGKYDEAVNFITKGLSINKAAGNKGKMKDNYMAFTNCYAQQGNYKLAYKYQQLYTQIKDTLFNEEKSKEIGRLEAKHEFEMKEMKRKAWEEVKAKVEAEAKARRDNLQYSGILIFIVLLFAGVFMLGRVTIPVRLAEGIIFFAFLLFFEFTLVLLDQYIERFSTGAPAIKLAFNAVVAALIFPLHAFFEGKLKKSIKFTKR
ncbi:MAG: tetratricopeptide repeat protein [Bacteroidota bacterium]